MNVTEDIVLAVMVLGFLNILNIGRCIIYIYFLYCWESSEGNAMQDNG